MVRPDGAATSEPEVAASVDIDRGPEALNALAVEALGKDATAVRRFLAAITPAIRRTCRGVLGRAHLDLEDAIQEALVDVMHALPSYRFEGHVLHYATKIALRVAIEARRRGTVRSGRFHPLAGQEADADRTKSADSDRFEDAELVRVLLRELKPTQAEALILHLALGFSVEEIASVTNARINSVRRRLRDGRASLKRKLERLGHAPPVRAKASGR